MTSPFEEPTGDELDQAIIAASRELTAAIRSTPRGQGRIDAARTEVNRLTALRDATA